MEPGKCQRGKASVACIENDLCPGLVQHAQECSKTANRSQGKPGARKGRAGRCEKVAIGGVLISRHQHVILKEDKQIPMTLRIKTPHKGVESPLAVWEWRF